MLGNEACVCVCVCVCVCGFVGFLAVSFLGYMLICGR